MCKVFNNQEKLERYVRGVEMMRKLFKLSILLIFTLITSIFTGCGPSAGRHIPKDQESLHVNPSDSSLEEDAPVYGAEVNPTGQPIGGGNGYTGGIKRDDPNVKYYVSTKDEFLEALSSCQPGETIWIEGDADIDMSYRFLILKGGITIASDRGVNGSQGGRIFQKSAGSRLFTVNGENVRLTGLRIEGPHKETTPVKGKTVALYCTHRYLEIDNCEIYGWSDAAIGIGMTNISPYKKTDSEEKTAESNDTQSGTGISDLEMKAGGYIHHNYFHHNQMEELGYGVVLSNGGIALIEANYFDYCRHAIAGTGSPGDGYEARYNICGPNWISTSPHNFDMHGFDTPEGKIAGDTIRIHHNTFMSETDEMPTCIAIRGVPREGAYIYNNWFYFTKDAPVWQMGGMKNVHVENNVIGPDKELVESGPIRWY